MRCTAFHNRFIPVTSTYFVSAALVSVSFDMPKQQRFFWGMIQRSKNRADHHAEMITQSPSAGAYGQRWSSLVGCCLSPVFVVSELMKS